jgi:MarR family transcriptional regulator for hemolysin
MQGFNPNESMGYHCNLTVRAFLGAWEGKLKGTGVSQAQLVALAQLVGSEPLSQTELVKRLSITAATGVRLVDRMERDGWVTRQPDPSDGRVKLVVPTQCAVDLWEKLSRAGRKVLDQAYRGISSEELESVKRILAKIRNNLKS